LKIKTRKIAGLKPSDRNARVHSPEQIEQIAESIGEFGFTNPILVTPEGTVVAGHGRLEAAKMLGLVSVPTIEIGADWTPEQIRAYVLADNQIAANSSWDRDMLAAELGELSGDGIDLSLLGFSGAEIDDLLAPDPGEGEGEGDGEKAYSRRIEAPIYTPKGDAPKPWELTDETKTRELKAEIHAADLPGDVREFLLTAAERHTVFDFRRIADFYASAEPATQRLMERSALVIIDFNQAIENGFVKLTQRLGDLAAKSPKP